MRQNKNLFFYENEIESLKMKYEKRNILIYIYLYVKWKITEEKQKEINESRKYIHMYDINEWHYKMQY